MRVNVFVDGVQVGTRNGCDVLVGEDACKKIGIGSTFFNEGLPRDICESCMAKMVPGSPALKFKTSHYDSINEKYSTEVKSVAEAIILETPPPLTPEPPKFPVCPHCSERSFSLTQVISEVKGYQWNSEAVKFTCEGEPSVEQKVLYHCKACGKEVPPHILSTWIQ